MIVQELIGKLLELDRPMARVTLGLCDDEANVSGGFFGDVEDVCGDTADLVQLSFWVSTRPPARAVSAVEELSAALRRLPNEEQLAAIDKLRASLGAPACCDWCELEEEVLTHRPDVSVPLSLDTSRSGWLCATCDEDTGR